MIVHSCNQKHSQKPQEHISQMSEKFIKHPLEAVSVGDVVDVQVIGVDLKKKRISLSMKGFQK